MTFKKIIASIMLGCFGVLAISFIISIFVVGTIHAVPSMRASIFNSLIMGASSIAISTAVYLSIRNIVFNRLLNIKDPIPFNYPLSTGNAIIVYGCIFFSVGISFYFRNYTFYVLDIFEADPSLSVSWLLSTVFLCRVFVLIAVYNERCGQAEGKAGGS